MSPTSGRRGRWRGRTLLRRREETGERLTPPKRSRGARRCNGRTHCGRTPTTKTRLRRPRAPPGRTGADPPVRRRARHRTVKDPHAHHHRHPSPQPRHSAPKAVELTPAACNSYCSCRRRTRPSPAVADQSAFAVGQIGGVGRQRVGAPTVTSSGVGLPGHAQVTVNAPLQNGMFASLQFERWATPAGGGRAHYFIQHCALDGGTVQQERGVRFRPSAQALRRPASPGTRWLETMGLQRDRGLSVRRACAPLPDHAEPRRHDPLLTGPMHHRSSAEETPPALQQCRTCAGLDDRVVSSMLTFMPLLQGIGPAGWFGRTSPASCQLEADGTLVLLQAPGLPRVWVRLPGSGRSVCPSGRLRSRRPTATAACVRCRMSR